MAYFYDRSCYWCQVFNIKLENHKNQINTSKSVINYQILYTSTDPSAANRLFMTGFPFNPEENKFHAQKVGCCVDLLKLAKHSYW